MNEPITERHVQALWYDGALRPQALRTQDGAALTVVDPGRWNLESGPDFREAVLEVGEARTRVVGDVEVHLRPMDWVAHGHARDPAYAHVVLHVVWYRGVTPPSEAGGPPASCRALCLGDALRTRPDFSPGEIDVTAYPYAHLPETPRPCGQVFSSQPDMAVWAMRAAGRRRLRAKAARLATRILRRGAREQVFYEEAFAALGYKYNAFPFRDVAAAVPWRVVPDDRAAALACYTCAAAMKVTAQAPWQRAHVRPSNTPARRLEAAAALFAEGPALMERLFACALGARAGQRAAQRILQAGGLGARRAAAVLANVVVPFALAEERLKEVPEWLCPEDLSAPVRLTAHRLLGRDHNPCLYAGNGLLIQGLLQIYRDHCLSVSGDCARCSLPAAFASRPTGVV